MAIQFARPWMGIAIPTLIILFIQLSTQYLMYANDIYASSYQVIYSITATMLWLSYYLAIFTPPGSPPPDFQIDKQQHEEQQKMWYKYCSKCKRYKPERTHHCKTCKTCVLKMDHHCPYTMSCIGYYNLPHFTRFLLWVIIGTSETLYFLILKIYQGWRNWNMPWYLITSRSEILLIVLTFSLDLLVLLTITILFVRTMVNLIYNQTTIETWEQERVESQFGTERLWKKIRSNYKLINKKDFPMLTSWKTNYRSRYANDIIPLNFSYEDLVFPYSLNSTYENLVQSLGPVHVWLWPWGKPTGDGSQFLKNDQDEDQLNLPWPPDGSNYEPLDITDDEPIGKEQTVGEISNSNWVNVLGETLDDFGVDMDTEEYNVDMPKFK